MSRHPFHLGSTVLLWLVAGLCTSALAQSFSTLPSRTNDVPAFAFTPSPEDWRAVPIYQVITDRYFDGDPANNDDNPDADINPFGAISIHGGDFEGIGQKLDYIQMLGARGVWISPVVRNVNGIFHGYAAQDLNQIDPHWGTLQDLRDLADALHARGMYLFIDVVQNHMGDLVTSTDFGYPGFNINGYNLQWRNGSVQHAAPFNNLSAFHNYGSVTDWGDATQQVLGDFAGLDGIRTEDPLVRQDLSTIYQALVAATDCDGFRVDTAKHIEMEFWEAFLPDLYAFTESLGKTNFLVFAEVFDGSDAYVASFTATNRFNSTLHFPMRQSMEDAFVWDQPTARLTDRYNGESQFSVQAREQLVNFLDNHDMPRYLSDDRLGGDSGRMKVALTFLYTYGQVPCLYYGTEQGFNGGNDPFDREDMFDGEFEFGPSLGDNFDFTHELYRHTRTLNLLRAAYPELVSGGFQERWQAHGGAGLYVFSRILGTNEVVVALNTSSSSQTAGNGSSGPGTTQAQGTVMVNVFDPGETVTVGSGGGPSQVTFTLPGHSFRMYVPSGSVRELPPSVVSVIPAHGDSDVVLSDDIVLTFDQPMERASVEAGFSLQPTRAGEFAWSGDGQQVRFAPVVPLSSNTQYVATLSAGCAGTNGLLLGAAFETFFDTGSTLALQKPLGDFVLDGQLDPGASLLALNNGVPLYGSYDAVNGALYLATVDAGEGNDHFIFIDDAFPENPQEIPSWNKNGTVASDGPFLSDENDNEFTTWFRVNASAAAHTGPNGGFLEGVINLVEQYGAVPEVLYLAVGLYPSPDSGTLLADYQVPASQNFDQNINTNEHLAFNPLTGEVTVPERPYIPGEVSLKQYNIDGQLSDIELEALRVGNAGLNLYADFNGAVLYIATEDAGEGNDHFIFVAAEPSPTNNAPWAKQGQVAGMNHFLADENDDSFAGWFINNTWDPEKVVATPINNGGYLEGVIDPVALFGSIPPVLYLCVGPYESGDNGSLNGTYQVPAGNGNPDIEDNEYYALDMMQFDTDGDGIPDLEEDVNANGVMDPGETGARVVDSDGDGMHDGQEQVTGSDPLDAQSRFQAAIVQVQPGSEPRVRIEWSSITGRLYAVYGTEVLGTGGDVWAPTPAVDLPGTGELMSYDALGASNTSRYFRVQVETAP